MEKQTHGGMMVARHLQAAGVTHLFTLCGGHISPILVEASRIGIAIIDARDSASAVFAADAHARLTGRPGVAVVTAGPGLTNSLTAVKSAQMAQSPVLILGGGVPTRLRHRGALQDMDQQAAVHALVKWHSRVKSLSQLDDALYYGLDISCSAVPGPVYIEVPADLLYPRERVRGMLARHTGLNQATGLAQTVRQALVTTYLWRQESLPSLSLRREARRLHQPLQDWRGGGQVADAANQLARARQPMLVLGSQALVNRNPAQAAQLAETVTRLGIPVWTTGMARGLLGANHPLLLRHRRNESMLEADMVIVAGMPFDFRLDYGRSFHRNATVVAANLSRRDLTRNRRPTVAIHSHPADFLTRLLEQRRIGQIEPWLQTLRERENEREAQIDAQAAEEPSQGVNPVALFRTLNRTLAAEDILVVDGGDFAATAAYTLHPGQPLCWLDPGVFGALGCGGGFVLGAGTARPGRRIWLLWGDGASALSLAEFDSFARHGLAPIALIGNDARWGQVAREQQTLLEDHTGTQLRLSDYHRVAEGYGGRGLLVTQQDEVPEALAEALRLSDQGLPVCINLHLAATDFRRDSAVL